jgi:hypothetical protein
LAASARAAPRRRARLAVGRGFVQTALSTFCMENHEWIVKHAMYNNDHSKIFHRAVIITPQIKCV